ncbi:MAG: methyltransferase domain-containing protein [Gammaproteobacteria bacterium]|nr:methyltransferase domain-containing protein [Gammaproteobacteria bacterium]
MSDADRQKWDERFAAGAYRQRDQPSEFLTRWLPQISSGRALDVACGAGRNALYLAQADFYVDAMDVSGVGLARARETATARGVDVNWIEHDLDMGIPGEDRYDLILMIRYVNSRLLESLPERLQPGGYLLCEEHLVTTADVIGPENPRFRVQPGELEKAARGMHILFCEEAVHDDPDGRAVALARLVARATPPPRENA